jgi:hypothetical protein
MDVYLRPQPCSCRSRRYLFVSGWELTQKGLSLSCHERSCRAINVILNISGMTTGMSYDNIVGFTRFFRRRWTTLLGGLVSGFPEGAQAFVKHYDTCGHDDVHKALGIVFGQCMIRPCQIWV